MLTVRLISVTGMTIISQLLAAIAVALLTGLKLLTLSTAQTQVQGKCHLNEPLLLSGELLEKYSEIGFISIHYIIVFSYD